MFDSVKKFMFKRNMKDVRTKIRLAWKNIKRADEFDSQGHKGGSSNCLRYACECLLESYESLCWATSYIPKYDLGAKKAVVELIMEHGDPRMYDYIFPGYRPVYEFGNKEIQKQWEEQVDLFVKNSKRLIPYEEILKEYPFSSILKDYNK
jgi:hypothetical protein